MVYDVTMLVRTQVLLDKHQKAMLDLHSQSSGRSVSDLVRESLDGYFVEKKSKNNVIDKWLKHIKKLPPSNAPKDLSSNDDYLYKL